MKARTWIFFALLLLVLVLVKIFFFSNSKKAAPPSKPKAQVVPVTVYVAGERLLENKILSSGTVMANETVELRPEVSGKLVSVNFREGSIVGRGQVLASVNDADLQAQLRKLSYQVQVARDKASRLKGLLAIEGVSKEEYELAQSQVQSLLADMDFVKVQIDRTRIRAPFSGRIGLRQVSPGAYVTPATLLATIQQTDLLKIEFTLPEKYAGQVKNGDLITFRVDNFNETFSAKVYAMEPGIDVATRNINIRALYKNASSKILPGSFARVELNATEDAMAVMIPTEAVIPELKGKKVFVSRGGVAIPQIVETGLRTDTEIEIISGLSPGDTVVITGIMSLKDSSKLKIQSIKQ